MIALVNRRLLLVSFFTSYLVFPFSFTLWSVCEDIDLVSYRRIQSSWRCFSGEFWGFVIVQLDIYVHLFEINQGNHCEWWIELIDFTWQLVLYAKYKGSDIYLVLVRAKANNGFGITYCSWSWVANWFWLNFDRSIISKYLHWY